MNKKNFIDGVKGGFPICLGYLPVSFTYGFMAVSGGFPIWLAVLISLTNLTSAGQFAGTNLMIAGAGFFELGLTTFIINIRYSLMSLALSQKTPERIPIWHRLIYAFGITDETFVVASTRSEEISTSYMLGLISTPILGWNVGTLLGGCISTILPVTLQNAMGIGLYAMFIALIIPASRESKKVLLVVLLAITLSCLMKYFTIFSFISSGFRVIIATVISAGIGAAIFPNNYSEEDRE